MGDRIPFYVGNIVVEDLHYPHPHVVLWILLKWASMALDELLCRYVTGSQLSQISLNLN